MGKRLPLARRLEVALQSISSTSEKKEVYGKLATFVDENINYSQDPESFYQQLTSDTLLPDDSNFDRETIQRGQSLCNYLSESITLPTPQDTPKYRQKMINAMKFEFECLKRYSQNE